MTMFQRVIVGISGGVDSAVAALLLKNKGFNVIGVFMKNWDIVDETGQCTMEKDYQDAQWVCNILKIPLVDVNFVKEYWNNVFSNLIEQYKTGFTPNPDILCNKNIKFYKFFHFARTKLQADAIATGHYVKTSFGPYLEHFEPNTNVHLLKARDEGKDQTFFLSQVPQETLRYSMFPLGEYLKKNVKKLACEAGLDFIAQKKKAWAYALWENGISEILYPRLVYSIYNALQYIDKKAGNFIDIDNGQVVGKHQGIHHWTVGQGCKLSGRESPYFVYKKDSESNDILVVKGTNHPALYTDTVITEAPHWLVEKPNKFDNNFGILHCDFRFQHRDPLIPCNVCKTSSNRLVIQLSQPLRALTPGQYCVLYHGEECLGSAPISHPGASCYALKRHNS